MSANMRARATARRVRTALVAIVVAQALLAGTAVALVVATTLVVLAIDAARAPAIGSILGVVVTAVVVWRSRAAWALERAALWIEERDPAMQYALVTAVDPRYPAYPAPAYGGALLRRAAMRAVGPVLLALMLVIGVREAVAAFHIGIHRRTRSGTGSAEDNRPPQSRLTPLAARIAPPAYSHRSTRDVKEPTSVVSLVGSVVTLRGPGDTAGLGAKVGDRVVAATPDGEDHWRLAVTMPAVATVVRLTDRAKDRLVVFEPVSDAPPTVELTAPARDSTMRVAQGTLPLAAQATDDIGLADGWFEVTVTAGEEESGGVHGRTLTVARMSFADARDGKLAGGLAFDALHLNPGDVVSIRAMARDGNTVSGPGVGTSETRTFRLATKAEYDSVAVDGAAPPGIDSSYMSQRLIVIATQELLKAMARRPRPVTRDTVVRVSRHLDDREENLKQRVFTLLHGSDGGAGGPGGEVMPAAERVLFDTAYEALNDAAMSLAVAEPKEALPRELVALAVLDSIRKMQKRLYLRGQPPPQVVNIARVRMTGTEKAEAGARPAAVPTDTVARRLARELAGLGGAPLAERPGVADSLALMQVAAYGVSPPLASALGDAVAALRSGEDAMPALARARRMLVGAARVDTTRMTWVAP